MTTARAGSRKRSSDKTGPCSAQRGACVDEWDNVGAAPPQTPLTGHLRATPGLLSRRVRCFYTMLAFGLLAAVSRMWRIGMDTTWTGQR
jgi:hypothetical protein